MSRDNLPKDWKKVKLGEIAEILMGQSPSSKFYNNEGIGLPFLQGNRTFGYKYPEIDTYCSNPLKVANKGDILFSVRAPVGEINIAHTTVCIGRGLAALKAKNGNNTFLFYLLHYLKNEILNAESGTVFGSINKTDLSNLEACIPFLEEEQKAIASVLSSLDDKIDLLHRQNKTLEQMAETLFRQWFIEEAREDWEEKRLGDFFPIKTGKKNANFSRPDGKYPFFTCSQEILHAPAYSFEGNAILLAGNGDFNIKRYSGKFEAYQRTYVLIPYDEKHFGFLYALMKFFLPEITGGYQGSVINFITKGMIENFKFLFPPTTNNKDIDKKFFQLNEIYSKVDANQSQIRTLEQLRDTLLPKLMSGEVGVKF